MMRNIEKNAKTPEEVILQHGEVYIRRVSFKTNLLVSGLYFLKQFN